jgi:hypothetical protein
VKDAEADELAQAKPSRRALRPQRGAS